MVIFLCAVFVLLMVVLSIFFKDSNGFWFAVGAMSSGMSSYYISRNSSKSLYLSEMSSRFLSIKIEAYTEYIDALHDTGLKCYNKESCDIYYLKKAKIELISKKEIIDLCRAATSCVGQLAIISNQVSSYEGNKIDIEREVDEKRGVAISKLRMLVPQIYEAMRVDVDSYKDNGTVEG
ncbi:hypothetical protein DA2_0694 [Desulfovibrio sp. A2]|nr:hypothetical protein DA2_0694 [Desulfovibrio sp. A2]